MSDALEDIRSKFQANIQTYGIPGSSYWRGQDGIVRFVSEVLKPDEIYDYQEEIIRNFVKYRRVAVKSPHGAGKSCVASWLILWLMSAYPKETDVKVVTTASAWRQLEKYLWPEIHKWARRAEWGRVGLKVVHGRELLGLSFRLENKEAFAAASDNPELLEGAHAQVVAYIFDEAKKIPDATWDSAEGAFSQEGLEGHEVFAFAISTPGDEVGRFYDIHQGKLGFADWWTRSITLDECIKAGQISKTWAENRKKQWGEDSVIYQRRVLGNFASSAASSVIPLSWVELSNERWLNENNGDDTLGYDIGISEDMSPEDALYNEMYGSGEESVPKRAIGVDPARFGDDKTVIAWFEDFTITLIEKMAKLDTMAIANKVHDYDPSQAITKAIDSIGLGAGVVDRLRELGHSVVGINVSAPTEWTDESGELTFLNTRSMLWWMLREYLDPGKPKGRWINLPPDDDLLAELVIPRWTETSRGAIKVESKNDIRRRLSGRSTDTADAVMLAMYGAIMLSSHGIYL